MIDVKQITFAVSPDWVGNEYASACPFSADNSRLLVVAADHFRMLLGPTPDERVELPIAASEEPRWHPTDHEVFYFCRGNNLCSYNIATGKTSIVRTFPEYTRISGKGEGSMVSEDGSTFALCGATAPSDVLSEVFTWGASGKIPVRPWDQFNIDSLYITPDKNVLISDVRGQALYSSQMQFLRWVTPTNGHKDVCRDTNGDEVLVWTSNADNAVYKLRLADSEPFKTKVKLLDLDWSLAVNISCPKMRQRWALVTTYGLHQKGQYSGQVLKVGFDGSVEVLCDTGSVQIAKSDGGIEYNPTPKTSVSRDGSMFVFSSNMGDVSNPNYINTYLGRIASTPNADKIDTQWHSLDYASHENYEYDFRYKVIGGRLTLLDVLEKAP